MQQVQIVPKGTIFKKKIVQTNTSERHRWNTYYSRDILSVAETSQDVVHEFYGKGIQQWTKANELKSKEKKFKQRSRKSGIVLFTATY